MHGIIIIINCFKRRYEQPQRICYEGSSPDEYAYPHFATHASQNELKNAVKSLHGKGHKYFSIDLTNKKELDDLIKNIVSNVKIDICVHPLKISTEIQLT